MTQHLHDLSHEFPEFKTSIHTLKIKDAHFRRMFEEYEAVSKELHRFGEGSGGISDDHAEELKKKRLELKDRLYAVLKQTAA